LCSTEFIYNFYFILSLYFKHNGMSSTKTIVYTFRHFFGAINSGSFNRYISHSVIARYNCRAFPVFVHSHKRHRILTQNQIRLRNFCLSRDGPNWGLGRHIVAVSRSQKTGHTYAHTHGRIPLNEWSARHRGRYLHNTQRTQEKEIHSPQRDSNP